jgi:hypothetical protein
MRKAITTSILILALSGLAYAGDIPNTTPVPPTAPGNIPCDVPALAYGGNIPNNVAGNVPNDLPQGGQTAVDIITETALVLLQNVLNVF